METTFSNTQLDEKATHDEKDGIDEIEGRPSASYKRYTQAFLIMFGFIISFGAHCNMGVAMVKMMSNETDENGDVTLAEFHWSPETIGCVDASFTWGYVITQIPGGFLASCLPANRVFGASIFLSSCLNLLIPAAIIFDPKAAIFVLFIQGLVEGLAYPASFGILGWWAPRLERSGLAAIAFSGSYGGGVLGGLVSWFTAYRIGWYVPFCFYGCAGICWYLFWLWLSFEKPSKHPTISKFEQGYIENSIGDSKATAPTIASTPWTKLLTSLPVWAIIFASFAKSWTFHLLLITQPKYFKEVYGMNVSEGSILAVLPHLIITIIVPSGGQFADWLRKKEILSTTKVRKIFNCGGLGGQAIFLLVVGSGQNKLTAILALIMASGSSGLAISGFEVNSLDIAPRYANILMGISNAVGTLAGMIFFVTTEQLTSKYWSMEQVMEDWGLVFLIASSINFLSIIFYAVFARGELQYWAIDASSEGPGQQISRQTCQIVKT